MNNHARPVPYDTLDVPACQKTTPYACNACMEYIMSDNTITSATLKVAKARRALCVALTIAIAEHNAKETDKSAKGRKAMERIGSMMLAAVANIAGKSVKFYNVDTMLAYMNTAKQSAQNALKACDKSHAAFLTECQRMAWRKVHSDTVEAVETFHDAWNIAKGERKPEEVKPEEVNA